MGVDVFAMRGQIKHTLTNSNLTSISYYCKTTLIFIDKSVKFNADYYVNKVFPKPFLTKDLSRIFPGREKKMVFHQESASGYTAKKTNDFLNKPKAEWMQRALMPCLWTLVLGVFWNAGFKSVQSTP